MKTLFVILAILALTPALQAQTLVNLEEAAEVESLELRLDSSGSGTVYARACDYCDLLALRVNSRTEVRRGRALISLEEAGRVRDTGATVLFDPATLQVTRIIFWK